MGQTINFALEKKSGTASRPVRPCRAIIAGWTGRDPDAMEAHIAELERLGVARPARTPMFYRVAANRLTTTERIEVIGNSSSGEVEFCLVNIEGEVWVGTGSDHTDRKAETYGVTLSKQMCDKPLAGTLWPLSEVSGHWSELQLRAHAVIGGERVVYQEGGVTAMLDPHDLIERFSAEQSSGGGFAPGDVMMCGTLPAIGGVRPAERFEFELVDPVLGRRIVHGYDIVTLPIEG